MINRGWNGTDLTEAEDIKKTWQEYTEELYIKKERKKERKIFRTQIHINGVLYCSIVIYLSKHLHVAIMSPKFVIVLLLGTLALWKEKL